MSNDEGDIIRGRYEAYVTPSNFLGEAGAFLDGVPTIGPVPDCENDDPADIKDAFDPVLTGHEKRTGRDGLSSIERFVDDEFEAGQAKLRARYLRLLEQGFSPQEARDRAVEY